jgi:hypothetical protein
LHRAEYLRGLSKAGPSRIPLGPGERDRASAAVQGSTLLGRGAPHALTDAYVNFSDDFGGLSVAVGAAGDGYTSRVRNEISNLTWLNSDWASIGPGCSATYRCP